MTPEHFIAAWQGSALTERAGARAGFCDLCDRLGVDGPRDPEAQCFARGAPKTAGGQGWADVWKRGAGNAALVFTRIGLANLDLHRGER